MPDRGTSPPINHIVDLKLPLPEQVLLDNGIPAHIINMGTQEVFKLEVIFNAGRPVEQKQMVARSTTNLLKEGCSDKTAAQIAEHFDFYGSTMGLPVHLDTSNLVLYGLCKHFETTIDLLANILLNPTFPQEEVDNYIQNSVERLQIDLAQPDVVCYRILTELIYGKEHPYGYNSSSEAYDKIDRNDLVNHWKNNFVANNCQILLSGKISDEMIRQLNLHLGKIPVTTNKLISFPPIEKQAPQKITIDHKGAVQTSIRIGRQLFNKHHPDFKACLFLNTVLGGYFGSRLMTNIREQKGYTYNIFSTVDTLHKDGYFYIGTEVGTDFTSLALTEIYIELDKLCQQKIGDKELQMVKNYMLGNLLTSLDGTFNVSDVVKTIVTEQLEFSYFDELVQSIHQITPEKLLNTAQKYLQKKDMWEVIVC